jgi:hypothetical protein
VEYVALCNQIQIRTRDSRADFIISCLPRHPYAHRPDAPTRSCPGPLVPQCQCARAPTHSCINAFMPQHTHARHALRRTRAPTHTLMPQRARAPTCSCPDQHAHAQTCLCPDVFMPRHTRAPHAPTHSCTDTLLHAFPAYCTPITLQFLNFLHSVICIHTLYICSVVLRNSEYVKN